MEKSDVQFIFEMVMLGYCPFLVKLGLDICGGNYRKVEIWLEFFGDTHVFI